MKVTKDAVAAGVECGLHEEGNDLLTLGDCYYDATFSIAEGEWIGASFFICEKCMPKFLAESEATRKEEHERLLTELREKIDSRIKEIESSEGWQMNTIPCLTVHESLANRCSELHSLKATLLSSEVKSQ